MKCSPLTSKASALALAIIFTAAQIQSATHFVFVDGSGFSPSSLNINTGDTVVWVNNDENFSHTTTSLLPVLNPNYWNSLLFDYLDTFGKTFNNTGTFNYYDQLDIGTGTITVSATTPPPIITLENPRIASGKFLFNATGLTVGNTHTLEVSTNMIQWIPVSTNVADNSSMTFTNVITAGPHLFRVSEQIP